MANKILIGIALDGDSEVKRKLQEVGEAGKRSLEDISNKIGNAKNAVGELRGAAGGLREALTFRGAAGGLREAIAPLTQASGLGGFLGGGALGSLLSKLATPGGAIAGFGAAITGALVGMAKIGEETDRLKQRLVGFGGGRKAFDDVTESAKRLGVEGSKLAPAFEDFLQYRRETQGQNRSVIRNPFVPQTDEEPSGSGVQLFVGSKLLSGGPAASNKQFLNAQSALLAQSKLDRTPTSEAADAIRTFFKSSFQLKEIGNEEKARGASADDLRAVQRVSPAIANAIAKAVAVNGSGVRNADELSAALDRPDALGRKALIPPDVLLRGLSNHSEQMIKEGNANPSLSQGAEALTAAVERKLETLGGDKAGIGPLLARAAQGIDKFQPEQRPFSSPSGPAAVPLGFLQNYFNPLGQLPAIGDLLSGYFNKDAQLPVPGNPIPEQRPADRISSSFSALPEATQNVSGLGTAANETKTALDAFAERLRAGVTVPVGTTGTTDTNAEVPIGTTGRAGGGAVFGAGTATSDSIPAMLSHGEYVINANAAGKIGLANLDRLNGYRGGGPILLADGGSSSGSPATLSAGSYDVVATDDGGAIINGIPYPPGAPILSVPVIAQALARSRAQKAQETKRTHKSDFVGLFGGHNFDTPGSYAKGGAVGHFATGGIMPSFDSGAAPSVADLSGGSNPWSDVPHLGSMDWNSHLGNVRVVGPAETLRHMQSAARDSADVQTGTRPSWYGRGK